MSWRTKDCLNRITEERENTIMHHPLLTGNAVLPTPQIATLCGIAARIMVTRQMGVCFTASSGMGKTTAMRYAAIYLRNKFPNLVVYNYNSRNHKAGSVRGFFKHMLTTVGHPIITGETGDLRHRLSNAIINHGRSSGHQTVLMLIDEAQALKVEDFMFLKDVCNETEEQGVTVVTLLMAQDPQFSAVQDELRREQRLDLMSRFTLSPRVFPAFQKEDDIKRVLASFDSTDSGDCMKTTWTEFFLPYAYSTGFRLENCAEKIYKPLAAALRERGLPAGIPARQLFSALKIFLVDASCNDMENFTFDAQLWTESVDSASLAEAAEIASVGTKMDFKLHAR